MSACGYDCSQLPKSLNTDTDITGIGVIIGYVATAGIVVAIITSYYFMAYDPDCDPFRKTDGAMALNSPVEFKPNQVDRTVLRLPRGTWKRVFRTKNSRLVVPFALEKSLIKCVLSMSDVQIVTGISILISGLAQLKCGLSCYHWQVLVNLAWFSSLTHLSFLTLLRNYLYNRPAERGWRLFSMTVLVALLFWGFIPTVNYIWLPGDWIPDHLTSSMDSYADYAICHLKPALPTNGFEFPSVYSAAISIALITVGFISRIIRLHKSSSMFARTIRGSLSRVARGFLRKVYKWCDGRESPRCLKCTLCYQPLLAMFLAIRILLDTWSSMFFEVWWLIASFAWGLIKLLSTLRIYPNGNNQWTFGQVMPVVLLAIPLITILEYSQSETSQAQQGLDLSRTSNTETHGQIVPSALYQQTLDPAIFVASDEMFYDPECASFYDSGLLTMPVLWTICSMILITLAFIILAAQRIDQGPSSLLLINLLGYNVLYSLYLSITLALVYMICLFSSTLFSFLVAMIGAKRNRQQRGRRPLRSGLWSLFAVVHVAFFFIAGFMATRYISPTVSMLVGVFPFAGGIMVAYAAWASLLCICT